MNALDEEIVEAFGGKQGEIEVETITLNDVLDHRGIERIDLLSMDIEGAEPAALRGFDIQRFRPDLCVVEGVKGFAVEAYFRANGYEPIAKYRRADKINLDFRRAGADDPRDRSSGAPTRPTR